MDLANAAWAPSSSSRAARASPSAAQAGACSGWISKVRSKNLAAFLKSGCALRSALSPVLYALLALGGAASVVTLAELLVKPWSGYKVIRPTSMRADPLTVPNCTRLDRNPLSRACRSQPGRLAALIVVVRSGVGNPGRTPSQPCILTVAIEVGGPWENPACAEILPMLGSDRGCNGGHCGSKSNCPLLSVWPCGIGCPPQVRTILAGLCRPSPLARTTRPAKKTGIPICRSRFL